jgi:hypothetical protein
LGIVHAVVVGVQMGENEVVHVFGGDLTAPELLKDVAFGLDDVVGIAFLGGIARSKVAEKAVGPEHAIHVSERLGAEIYQGLFAVGALDEECVNHKRQAPIGRVAFPQQVVCAHSADTGMEGNQLAGGFVAGRKA